MSVFSRFIPLLLVSESNKSARILPCLYFSIDFVILSIFPPCSSSFEILYLSSKSLTMLKEPW